MTTRTITTEGLGKRFGRTWAVSDCTFDVPERSLCALGYAVTAGI